MGSCRRASLTTAPRPEVTFYVFRAVCTVSNREPEYGALEIPPVENAQSC